MAFLCEIHVVDTRAGVFIINILFCCLAVIFEKATLQCFFMCVFVVYVQKPSTFIFLALQNLNCVLIISNVGGKNPQYCSTFDFFTFKCCWIFVLFAKLIQ